VIVGALAAGIGVALLIVGAQDPSIVERRIALILRPRKRIARPAIADGIALRIGGAIGGATLGCLVGWTLGLGPLPVPLLAFAGSSSAAFAGERRAAARRRHADREMVTVVEWLYALVASGRPLESAVARMTSFDAAGSLIEDSLSRVRRDYALGVPLHDAVHQEGLRSGVRGLVLLGERLERARELGRAALPVLQDLRDELRASERARSLEAASQVEGKLTLILALCYLPALALLVMIPLFLTLLAGLFG
jgi:Flp pilus assembly protein TadB